MSDKLLVPITKELIDSLHGQERTEALQFYHDWLLAERKNDYKEVNNLHNKICNFIKRKEDPEERDRKRKEFVNRYNKKKRLIKRKDLKCHVCNKSLTNIKKATLCCSPECAEISKFWYDRIRQQEDRINKVCITCGNKLEVGSKKMKYCSDECKPVRRSQMVEQFCVDCKISLGVVLASFKRCRKCDIIHRNNLDKERYWRKKNEG